MSQQTVISWRARHEAGGIAGLEDHDRSGRQPVRDEVAVVVAATIKVPAKLEATHWSTRLPIDELGISFATVARMQSGLSPTSAYDRSMV